MKRKANRKSEAQVDPELKGLAISVNEFGEVVANVAIDKLNDFQDIFGRVHNLFGSL